MKLRTVTQTQYEDLEACEYMLGWVIRKLRKCGARKSANYVARSRKSVQGAVRHAARIRSKA